MATTDRPIIIYHYTFSPYARRITWYLTLRGIPFTECLQPPILPRPDVNSLGISYRRIPIVSIGRDIYLDTRLQLLKLEESPHLSSISPPLAPTAESGCRASIPDTRLMTRLLESWCIDSGLMSVAASLIPLDFPLMKDPKFLKDRAELRSAPSWPPPDSSSPGAEKKPSPEAQAQAAKVRRAESLQEAKSAFQLLEDTVFNDGREWIVSGTNFPTVADIEAVWLFHWLIIGMPAALDTSDGAPFVTEEEFPRVFAWVRRFDALINEKKKEKNRTPKRVKGEEARRLILGSLWNEEEKGVEKGVDEKDSLVQALGLRKGDEVVVHPTDTGKNHKDVGRLVKMDSEEVVWEVKTKEEGEAVRVHAPRHGFRVRNGETSVGKL
ncbi:hypothetical protein MKZ38_001817 [Zalerion maritima]|uniref:GST C-terminal domain-containing protein n=1 Tax=Zalerion maritima TaxID=339359 RepID=A0AAD5RQT2_9PEZI|nr:hypothetical protein MKZ38_001817 [Zalerion maritima]